MPDLDSYSVEELGAMLDGIPPPPPPPEAAEEPESAPEPASVEPAESPTEPVAEESEEVQEEATDWKARAEELEAKVQELQAHSSRLAGAKGHFERRFRELAAKRGVDPDDPTPDLEEDPDAVRYELASVRGELADLQSERERERLKYQDLELVRAADARLAAANVDPAIVSEVTARYGEEWMEAQAETDPDARKRLARATLAAIVSASLEAATEKKLASAKSAKQAATARSIEAKKAASISASGAVPAAPPRPKSFAEMSAEEADRWLRENAK